MPLVVNGMVKLIEKKGPRSELEVQININQIFLGAESMFTCCNYHRY